MGLDNVKLFLQVPGQENLLRLFTLFPIIVRSVVGLMTVSVVKTQGLHRKIALSRGVDGDTI